MFEDKLFNVRSCHEISRISVLMNSTVASCYILNARLPTVPRPWHQNTGEIEKNSQEKTCNYEPARRSNELVRS
jgi:hypothetical protein